MNALKKNVFQQNAEEIREFKNNLSLRLTNEKIKLEDENNEDIRIQEQNLRDLHEKVS